MQDRLSKEESLQRQRLEQALEDMQSEEKMLRAELKEKQEVQYCRSGIYSIRIFRGPGGGGVEDRGGWRTGEGRGQGRVEDRGG